MSDDTVKYLLPESEIPTHWINLVPDLPGRLLHLANDLPGRNCLIPTNTTSSRPTLIRRKEFRKAR